MPHIKTPTQQPSHLIEACKHVEDPLLHGDSHLGHEKTISILCKVDVWFSWNLLPSNQQQLYYPMSLSSRMHKLASNGGRHAMQYCYKS